MRFAPAAIIFSSLLLGCDAGPQPEALVVYAVGTDKSILTSRFSEFTDDTGIPVTLQFSKSSTHVDLVIHNSGSPTADVLVTNNVADIWRAADEGALRLLRSDKLQGVADHLKDPEGLWVATGYRRTVVAVNRQAGIPQFNDFNYLARAELRGQLCLVSAASPLSRSLIAMLIAELGVKPAERLVRGWIHNLAAAPFESELALLDAVRSGTCVYGIVSDAVTDGSTHVIAPGPGYFDIDGIGVARHARNPENALRLVDWMISRQLPDSDAVIASEHNIGIAGWRDEDARLLAERALYR